jgi:uncharacterized protein YndB with AHSA1/START domain
MTPSSVNQIERRILIRAPRSRVWRALTGMRQFCQWFSADTSETEFRPGARVRLVSTYGGECYKQEFFMDIVEMEAEHTFSWRWHPGSPVAGEDVSKEPMTLVVFHLEDAASGTLVTVTESGFDRLFPSRITRVLAENEAGWKIQMEALERYLEQNLDGAR